MLIHQNIAHQQSSSSTYFSLAFFLLPLTLMSANDYVCHDH